MTISFDISDLRDSAKQFSQSGKAVAGIADGAPQVDPSIYGDMVGRAAFMAEGMTSHSNQGFIRTFGDSVMEIGQRLDYTASSYEQCEQNAVEELQKLTDYILSREWE